MRGDRAAGGSPRQAAQPSARCRRGGGSARSAAQRRRRPAGGSTAPGCSPRSPPGPPLDLSLRGRRAGLGRAAAATRERLGEPGGEGAPRSREEGDKSLVFLSRFTGSPRLQARRPLHLCPQKAPPEALTPATASPRPPPLLLPLVLLRPGPPLPTAPGSGTDLSGGQAPRRPIGQPRAAVPAGGAV